MTIHLLRMAAGIGDMAELQAHIAIQTRKIKGLGPAVSIYTRNTPKRAAEMIDGGSVYNVIRSVIQCRRQVLDVRQVRDSQGNAMCEILLDPELIRVMPTQQNPFQGWRYLEPARAPRDLGTYKTGESEPPAEMAKELRAMGLI